MASAAAAGGRGGEDAIGVVGGGERGWCLVC